MTTLTTARTSLGALLAGPVEALGAIVVDHVPEELPAPCVVIDAPDENYLELGDTFSRADWWITLRVLVLVDLTANEQATGDLEDLLAAVLPPLTTSSWEVDPIGRPGPWRTTQWLAHGVAITVRNLITLNPGETP